ncbi:HipA family kinase [Lactiplantibacillus plantarum]|uniref:HipA family kinase n=1 Tax=Lactiplantibacillus plantarum TaxID=1590 RepID=UPI0029439C0E|nr:HipA family kinase [Lactiplantibacillus plantarum]WOI03374.1 HipA family kinase [Lactiplantibacillus plantarum]
MTVIEKADVDQINNALNPQAGQSKPIAVLASNNKRYLLKKQFVDRPNKPTLNEDSVFMQELLVYQLAVYLGIPVPGFAILNIEEEFINENRDYLFAQHLKPGLYFGTEMLPNVENNLVDNYIQEINNGKPYIIKSWNTYFQNVINADMYADIIALDCFTLNGDRFTNGGNLLVASNNQRERKVYAIDFGHCFFSPCWDSEKISRFHRLLDAKDSANCLIFSNTMVDKLLSISAYQRPAQGFGQIFRAMESNITFTNGNPFNEIVNKIAGIPDNTLLNMLQSIPSEWVVGSEMQINLYLRFLSRQKLLVQSMLDRMYTFGAFSNSLGGNLQWQTDTVSGMQL